MPKTRRELVAILARLDRLTPTPRTLDLEWRVLHALMFVERSERALHTARVNGRRPPSAV